MTKQTVTVYEKDNCQACRMTKRWLDQHGIEYATDDITKPDNLEAAKSLGFMEAPVVMVGDTGWSGFQPDKLKSLLD